MLNEYKFLKYKDLTNEEFSGWNFYSESSNWDLKIVYP